MPPSHGSEPTATPPPVNRKFGRPQCLLVILKLMVVRALGRRHLSPFQPPLKGYPSFSGNLLHRNMFG